MRDGKKENEREDTCTMMHVTIAMTAMRKSAASMAQFMECHLRKRESFARIACISG